MKITKLDVTSFGAVNGFFADLSENNMTLIYGDNEAGKSTLTEFIRSTLFPPARAPKYPASKRTDQGTICLEMSDGGTRILQREQRKVKEKDGKLTPDVEFHMDSDTFRSLFALDLEQLTNDKMLSNGEFRKKFLTVPGGENVPEVNKAIRTRMDDLMNRGRITDSKVIGHLYKEAKRLSSELSSQDDDAEAYDALSAEKVRLLLQLGEAKNMSQAAAFEENKEFMLESLKENMQKLDDMKARRAELTRADTMSDEDVVRYGELNSKIAALDDLIDGTSDEEDPDTMGTEQAERILALSDRIEAAWADRNQIGLTESTLRDLRLCYEQDMEAERSLLAETGYELEDALSVSSDAEVRDMLLNPDNKLQVSGRWGKALTRNARALIGGAEIVTVGAGVAVALTTSLTALGVGIAIIGAGAAVVTCLFPRFFNRFFQMGGTDWSEWLPQHGFTGCTDPEEAVNLLKRFDEVSELDKRMKLTEQRMSAVSEDLDRMCSECTELCSEMGISNGSLNEDLDEMYGTYILAKSTLQVTSDSDGLFRKRDAAEAALNEILDRYGGAEEFKAIRIEKAEARELDLSIEALNEAVESAAGMTSEVISRSVKGKDVTDPKKSAAESQEEVDRINVRIGEINREMRSLTEKDRTAELKQTLETTNAKLKESVREWAMLSLAETLIGECSNHFYSELQPSVMKTANHYLDLMTEGRYRIANDPRDSEISIEDRRTKKYSGDWSSGLGDQVYLAVKMAIAKEMGTERMPFIMDDVLVRFDSRRKQGACRAILDFAKDQQAIMFTCDSTLYSMFSLEGSLNYIHLR